MKIFRNLNICSQYKTFESDSYLTFAPTQRTEYLKITDCTICTYINQLFTIILHTITVKTIFEVKQSSWCGR